MSTQAKTLPCVLKAELRRERMTMTSILNQVPAQVNSPRPKSQREWIPMESERLAEFETKSRGPGPRLGIVRAATPNVLPCSVLGGQQAEHEAEPAPLLARSVSTGGVCPRPGACGLQNLGNTCFINSMLPPGSRFELLCFWQSLGRFFGAARNPQAVPVELRGAAVILRRHFRLPACCRNSSFVAFYFTLLKNRSEPKSDEDTV